MHHNQHGRCQWQDAVAWTIVQRGDDRLPELCAAHVREAHHVRLRPADQVTDSPGGVPAVQVLPRADWTGRVIPASVLNHEGGDATAGATTENPPAGQWTAAVARRIPAPADGAGAADVSVRATIPGVVATIRFTFDAVEHPHHLAAAVGTRLR